MFATYLLLVGNTPVKFLLMALVGILLAVAVHRTFGAATWLGAASTLALVGFFFYGVLYQYPPAFYPAFAAFFFAATITIIGE